MRILIHAGVIEGQSKLAGAMRFIDVGAGSAHCTSDYPALAQIHVRPGEKVAAGTVVATLFDPHNFGTIFTELRAQTDGWVAVCRRNPLVDPGDHLCMICQEIPRGHLF